MISRDDMLELTRRMTPKRTCFSRVAGCYVDRDGDIDGTFNIHFGKLSEAEKKTNLEIAKTIPFAKTNEQLKGRKHVDASYRHKREGPEGRCTSQHILRDHNR